MRSGRVSKSALFLRVAPLTLRILGGAAGRRKREGNERAGDEVEGEWEGDMFSHSLTAVLDKGAYADKTLYLPVSFFPHGLTYTFDAPLPSLPPKNVTLASLDAYFRALVLSSHLLEETGRREVGGEAAVDGLRGLVRGGVE